MLPHKLPQHHLRASRQRGPCSSVLSRHHSRALPRRLAGEALLGGRRRPPLVAPVGEGGGVVLARARRGVARDELEERAEVRLVRLGLGLGLGLG